MDFRRGARREEPEMNLVPMIDVLLVIVIFLVVTTTYSRYSELQINLPSAEANQVQERPNQVNVAVTANGQYVVDRVPLSTRDPAAISVELKRAARGNPDPMIIINADANSTHQSVVNVMEAARMAGFGRITFTTQQPSR
ncbi:MAG TPA: biopolymer transporter ExbD [Burkholderiales bacterium]|jgi:biopolymer transport protein ExbD|nr:biopolymer transporter ExbD [Burkholderiales bacterium]